MPFSTDRLPPALRSAEDMAARSCLHSISHFLEPIRPPRPAKRRSHVRAPSPICGSRTKPHTSSSSSGEDVLFPDQRLEKKGRRGQRAPRRRLITISTSDGRWHGQWNCDYVFSLGELGLADVADGGQADAEVLVSLTIEKINTTFEVWVLPSGRSDPLELPEIGGNDPSVIYVKPGSEADLDSLIRDTIRLAASAKDTCSESCEKSTPRWNYIDGKSTYDRRWHRLLEIRNAYKDVPPD